MRTLLLAGLLLAATAHAQDAAPAPTPDPAPAAAPPAPSPDTVLLRALLWAHEPSPEEIRVMAIEDLALLGDARALDALGALVWDPNPRLQAAAVRAIALFQHPRAEQLLADVVRHPSLPEPLKLQALGGLLFQRTATARATVVELARNPRASPTVQSAALAVATKWDATPTPPESPK
jgi:HEAT repeat protein